MIRFVVTGNTEEQAFTRAQEELERYHGRVITRCQVFEPVDVRTICAIMDNPRLWADITRSTPYDDRLALMFPITVKRGRDPRWLVALNTKE